MEISFKCTFKFIDFHHEIPMSHHFGFHDIMWFAGLQLLSGSRNFVVVKIMKMVACWNSKRENVGK